MESLRNRGWSSAAALLLLVSTFGIGVARAQVPTHKDQDTKPQAKPTPAAAAYPGYTMFAVGTTACLADMDGKIVHKWAVAKGKIKTTPYLLPDGSVLFPLNKGGFTFRPGGAHGSGTFQRVSWEGKLLWDFSFYGKDFTPSYDVEPMPNGNILVCAAYKDRSRPGKLFEIEPVGKTGGKIVWECHVSEKLGETVKGYINSVSYNSITDQVLVNIQAPGRTVAVFDHSDAKARLLFKWSKGFSGRLHGGTWITNTYLGTNIAIPGAKPKLMRIGNILTISNSDNQAVEIDPRTKKQVRVFRYKAAKNQRAASHQGSVQRLPNGNTLVVPGYSDTVSEFDGKGNLIWTMKAPKRVARAYRYGVNYPGVAKLKQR